MSEAQIRVEFVWPLIKKVIPKNTFIKGRTVGKKIVEYWEANEEKIRTDDTWINGKSTSFINPGWVMRKAKALEEVAASDGWALEVMPFKGWMLTRNVKKIAACEAEKAKHLETKAERHNTRNEKLVANPRYNNLEVSFFHQQLLPFLPHVPPEK